MAENVREFGPNKRIIDLTVLRDSCREKDLLVPILRNNGGTDLVAAIDESLELCNFRVSTFLSVETTNVEGLSSLNTIKSLSPSLSLYIANFVGLANQIRDNR